MKKLILLLFIPLVFTCSSDSSDDITNTTSEQQLTYIPYDFWESRLIDLGLDDVMDNYVLSDNISEIEEFEFFVRVGPDINVMDFTGIEDFISLKQINIHYTACIDGDTINCSIEQVDNVYIENFNISTLSDLERIHISSTVVNLHFDNFNLLNNVNLKSLWVGGTTIYVILNSTLDLSNNINLEGLTGTFYTNGNFGVIDVDVSNNVNLKTYEVGCGLMNNINLNNNILLEYLSMDCVEGLNELDLSNNVNLKFLNLNSQLGSNLDLTNNINLENLRIFPLGASSPNDGFLTEINLTNHPNLTFLALTNNKLTELDISNCNQESITVYASGNNLTCVEASQSQINNGTFFIYYENGDEVDILTDCN